MKYDISKKIAEMGGVEGVPQVHKKGLLGDHSKAIIEESRKCVCGLCLSLERVSKATECHLFAESNTVLVNRQENELCKSFCLSNSGLLHMFSALSNMY